MLFKKKVKTVLKSRSTRVWISRNFLNPNWITRRKSQSRKAMCNSVSYSFGVYQRSINYVYASKSLYTPAKSQLSMCTLMLLLVTPCLEIFWQSVSKMPWSRRSCCAIFILHLKAAASTIWGWKWVIDAFIHSHIPLVVVAKARLG